MRSKIYQNILLTTLAAATIVAPVPSVLAMSQDETVYVKMDSDGKARNISVTEHLINDLKENQLLDQSILDDIENLNGYETFTVDGSNLTWQANNKDIYYRGTTTKELPVEMKVAYALDGEEKPIEEILGKSGHVEIKLKYINHAKVDDLYTPFVVAVATTLDESKVSNVEVTNGKTISNGRKIAVAAVAAPGLYESLKLDELENADEVVLSFDTESMELGEIYSIVTPKLLDAESLKTFTQLDQLYGDMNTLSSSSQELVAGAKKLNSGTNELKTGVAGAKQKLQALNISIDAATMNSIKTTASNTAAAKVEAERATIAAGVKQQISSNTILMNALELQAAQMCSAAIGGATCPPENIAATKAQLVAGVENSLTESSISLMKQTAITTATTTAEKVANEVATSAGQKIKPMINEALNTMQNGANQLANGAATLSAGMTKFDREGIQPLANFVNGKVKVTADTVERLLKLADQYDNYAGKSNGVTGTTKFIMMIGGKKAE